MKGFTAFTLITLFFQTLYADVSFITESEYASQLYHSPRGIGCFKCHGEKGEGRLIATYKDKGEQKSFHPPAINGLSFSDSQKALETRQKGMPRYYLTKEEVTALYLYLHPKEVEDAN